MSAKCMKKYKEVVKAWLDGDTIQVYEDGKWWDCSNPDWHEGSQYRVAPKTTTFFGELSVLKQNLALSGERRGNHNIVVVFDDEGDLVSISKL